MKVIDRGTKIYEKHFDQNLISDCSERGWGCFSMMYGGKGNVDYLGKLISTYWRITKNVYPENYVVCFITSLDYTNIIFIIYAHIR